MPVLPIRFYGDPVLRQRAKEMTAQDVTQEFRQHVLNMGETMYSANGVGLAANQIGDLRRMFVIDVDQVTGDGKRSRKVKDPTKRFLQAIINPEILESSDEDEPYFEGCLSIPEIEHDVFRPTRIKVRYRTIDWELREEWLDGLIARVFQHEFDHLDGVLFVDRLAESQRATLAGALNALKRRGTSAEQSA